MGQVQIFRAEIFAQFGVEKESATPVTWKRILENAIEAREVEKVFGEYLRSMSEDESELWNLDGKVVCRVKSEATDKQLHLLALQESEVNLVIERTALSEDENEISAGKRLLRKVDLRNKIVSGDAIFAQQELSKTVVEKGGEYWWKLRANQGSMYQLAKEHFEKLTDKYPGKTTDIDKGHGRVEERIIFTSFRIAGAHRVSVS